MFMIYSNRRWRKQHEFRFLLDFDLFYFLHHKCIVLYSKRCSMCVPILSETTIFIRTVEIEFINIRMEKPRKYISLTHHCSRFNRVNTKPIVTFYILFGLVLLYKKVIHFKRCTKIFHESDNIFCITGTLVLSWKYLKRISNAYCLQLEY